MRTMHLHRAQAHLRLYGQMNPTTAGHVVKQIPWHAKWMRELASKLNRGRAGLFRRGDLIRVEPPGRDGRNLITHVATGVQVGSLLTLA